MTITLTARLRSCIIQGDTLWVL